MAEVRQLKIKTGSVQRLSKELGMYATEQATEAARVAKMRMDDADSHDIQHAVRLHSRIPPPPSPRHASAPNHVLQVHACMHAAITTTSERIFH